MKVAEIIVVEKKDDTRRVQGVVAMDTIETIESAISDEILTQIEYAQETRGVIIFIDPSYLGEKTRKAITEVIPDAKHALLSGKVTVPKKNGGNLGVEHASDRVITEALKRVVTPVQADEDYQEIPRQTLIEYGLIAGANARKYRELLGDDLRIGYTDSRQLVERLSMLRTTEAELKRNVTRTLKELANKE